MEIYRFGFNAMGGNGEVVIALKRKKEAHAIANLVLAEVGRIEYKYSRYQKQSIVSRINAAAGRDFVEYDNETAVLIQYADTLYKKSDALFDITSGVLRHAWDFSKGNLPEPAKLSEQLPLVGWQQVERQNNAIRLPACGMEIDFGGFGKEYAADRAAAILHNKGVKHGYVNLAGDIMLVGPKPDGTPWVIGIQDPRHKERIIASIPLYTGALTTSGDYERYFEVDEKRYCHIIHPRSGYPVTFWRSVTIIAPSAITAGSFSTIAMLKEAEGLTFLENSGFGYLAVDQLGIIYHKNM
ncbi:MAG: FAD:protein FMN transferase [Chlorobium sp.]|jgi:thiamine biosynthesis lipoprotein|nr:FAD:protein FMN transferase [Chlorobium sp.]